MVSLHRVFDVTVTVGDGQVQIERSSDHKDQRVVFTVFNHKWLIGVTKVLQNL
jgi:hypothetical protein